MGSWSIVHSNHGGTVLGEEYPIELEFEIGFEQINSCSYKLSTRSSLGVKGKTEPYVTDFLIERDGREIIGGLHTGVEHRPGSSVITVAGLEWLHLYELTIYPWTPGTFAAPFTRTNTDTVTIARDLIDGSRSLGTYTLDLSGLLTNYVVEYGDIENIYNKVLALSQMNPGFDFDINPAGNTFTTYSPKKGTTPGVTLESGVNVDNAKIDNQGVKGNKLYGLGSAVGVRLAVLDQDSGSQTTYRRLDAGMDYGDVQSQAGLDALNDSELIHSAKQFRSISFDTVPGFDFFGYVDLGDTVKVRIRDDYEVIDDDYRIIQIHCEINAQGDEKITLAFEEA